MSITASCTVQIQFSGDVTENIIQSALDNTASLKKDDFVTLAIGDNVLPVPAVTGYVVTRLSIFPPAGNTTIITMMGQPGDIGFPIHITDPTSLALDPSFTTIDLNVPVQIVGVRLIWN
jgi:hypothetical protein